MRQKWARRFSRTTRCELGSSSACTTMDGSTSWEMIMEICSTERAPCVSAVGPATGQNNVPAPVRSIRSLACSPLDLGRLAQRSSVCNHEPSGQRARWDRKGKKMEIDLACGHEAEMGSEVFSHYTMRTGFIVRLYDDGWFDVLGDDHGNMLNGARTMCLSCGTRYWPEQCSRSRA